MKRETQPDLIIHNGRITRLDPSDPEAENLAVKDGRVVGVDDADGGAVLQNLLAGRDPQPAVPCTQVVVALIFLGGGRFSLDARVLSKMGINQPFGWSSVRRTKIRIQ